MGSSPDGKYYLYLKDKKVVAYDVAAGRSTVLGGGDKVSFVDVTDDHPYELPVYGVAGWSKDGKSVILNHRFDLYSVPTGRTITLTKPIVSNYRYGHDEVQYAEDIPGHERPARREAFLSYFTLINGPRPGWRGRRWRAVGSGTRSSASRASTPSRGSERAGALTASSTATRPSIATSSGATIGRRSLRPSAYSTRASPIFRRPRRRTSGLGR